jgi:Trk K+ transport system NAD-binding subunit
MKRNKFVIIGLGDIGQELLKKLSKDFDIVCIDLNPESEEIAKKIRGDSKIITGDATSRLVLEEAGVADADGIIITTTTEKINLETARILREHFDAKRIIAIGTTKAGIEGLESLGVEVENIVIRNRLEQTSRTAHAIGLGKNEIFEVEVHPHSRLANRRLGTLTPIRWRIGIIYREDNIVIPRHDTVLKPKDRVVILGDPSVLKTVSEILTFRFQRFPLEYGSKVIAYLTGNEHEEFFNELDYLFSIFPLHSLVFLYSKKAAEKADFFEQHIRKENIKNVEIIKTVSPPLRAIGQTLEKAKGEHGLITISKSALFDPLYPFIFDIRKKNFLNKLSHISACPVLVSTGTFPYEKAVVPCIEEINLQHSLETALEIASSLNNEVTALLMKPSKYISSDEDIKNFEGMKKTINDVSLMYKTRIKTTLLDGNPVKLIAESLHNYNLLIVDTGGLKEQKWFSSFLNPDVAWHIIKNSSISTLLLPRAEETL